MAREKILVTSALPYANGKIHLGHLSGAYLPADIYVRYHRLKGSDIVYICGSDEHGVPITITADKEGVKPKDIIDRYHTENEKAFERFGMSFDIYSRTSIPEHHKTAQEFFKTYYDQGLLTEQKSLQFYDEKAKMFLPDRYVEGTCPNCGFEEARSDECEKCGALYDPKELENPKSKITGETPVLKETSHWFFPLNKFQKRLEDYIAEMDEKYGWKENVKQYCRGWFKDGLRERAVTRDLDWGVKIPLEGFENKVLYVWFEAVLGYISATKKLSEKRNDPDMWRRYWQDPDTKYVAFIGKDNVVFHTIIFPAMLMGWNDANEDKYVLPQNVPANEFLNFEGKKFSKSRGWGVDVDEFLEMFPADSLRYTLAANLPENKDTDFYWKEFQARNNSELADILGNFINRTFTFTFKHFEGKLPEAANLQPIDEEMLASLKEYTEKIGALIDKYKVKEAVLEMMNLTRSANKYFNDSEPWKKIKTDKAAAGVTLNVCLQTAYTLAQVFSPVIPDTAEKLYKMLNREKTGWDESGNVNLEAGHQLKKAELLFGKIEDDIIDKQMSKLGVPEETEEPEEEKPKEITIDRFFETVLTVGEIVEAEKIKKSNKLLKLQVDIGKEKRQVVAGIAKSYKPEELPGKKVIIVSNLQPAKLFGNESQGMVLAGDDGSGKVKIVEPDKSIKNGTRIS